MYITRKNEDVDIHIHIHTNVCSIKQLLQATVGNSVENLSILGLFQRSRSVWTVVNFYITFC